MAEALLRDIGGDRFDVVSAGAEATPIDPEATDAMLELGIDISRQHSISVDQFLGKRFSYVISLCDRQQERSCPIFPGAIWRLQWKFDDPATAGTREEYRKMVRRVRGQIRGRVIEFAATNK